MKRTKKMKADSNLEKRNAQKCLVLPYDVYIGILKNLSLADLLGLMQAVENSLKPMPNMASRNGHNLNDALVDFLLTSLHKVRLEGTYLQSLSHCDQVISHLEKVNLLRLEEDYIPWFQRIRQRNPNIAWISDMDSDDLGLINDPETLRGLPGTLDIIIYTEEDLRILGEICERCHPSIGMKPKIDSVSMIRMRHILDCAPILPRLRRLTANVFTENELSHLDTMRGIFEFELVLHMRYQWQFLRKCSYVPKNLVKLGGELPIRDDISCQRHKHTAQSPVGSQARRCRQGPGPQRSYRLLLRTGMPVNDPFLTGRRRCLLVPKNLQEAPASTVRDDIGASEPLGSASC